MMFIWLGVGFVLGFFIGRATAPPCRREHNPRCTRDHEDFQAGPPR